MATVLKVMEVLFRKEACKSIFEIINAVLLLIGLIIGLAYCKSLGIMNFSLQSKIENRENARGLAPKGPSRLTD